MPPQDISGKDGALPWTPGPWRIDPSFPMDIQSGDGALEIAGLSPRILTGGVKPSLQQIRANARLIAAAPALYEALAQVRQAIINQYGFSEAWPVIEAALSLAHGEQP